MYINYIIRYFLFHCFIIFSNEILFLERHDVYIIKYLYFRRYILITVK